MYNSEIGDGETIGSVAIEWRAAALALRPFVIGFVQRIDAFDAGASLQLPFAIPVIHISMVSERSPRVSISAGIDVAAVRALPASGATFVIALGFAGAAMLAPAGLAASHGCFSEMDGCDWRSLAVRLAETPGFAERTALVEAFLLSSILLTSLRSSPVHDAADAIAQDRWSGRACHLAARLGVEERTLRNRFRRELGWSPKRLLSVARFNRAVRTIHPRPWMGRAEGDTRLEFFDDAHFYRQFLAYAGVTPAAFVAAKERSRDGLVHNLRLMPAA